MDSVENLCIIAMEECAEVQQSLSKCMRFGFDNYHPNTPEKLNHTEVLKEYYQLQAVIEMLITNGVLDSLPIENINKIKQEKINNILRFNKISRSCGRLD